MQTKCFLGYFVFISIGITQAELPAPPQNKLMQHVSSQANLGNYACHYDAAIKQNLKITVIEDGEEVPYLRVICTLKREFYSKSFSKRALYVNPEFVLVMAGLESAYVKSSASGILPEHLEAGLNKALTVVFNGEFDDLFEAYIDETVGVNDLSLAPSTGGAAEPEGKCDKSAQCPKENEKKRARWEAMKKNTKEGISCFFQKYWRKLTFQEEQACSKVVETLTLATDITLSLCTGGTTGYVLRGISLIDSIYKFFKKEKFKLNDSDCEKPNSSSSSSSTSSSSSSSSWSSSSSSSDSSSNSSSYSSSSWSSSSNSVSSSATSRMK